MKATLGPRFWHRTRRRPSFWLGLFVACFLAWAWWDSTQQETWVQMQVSSGTRGIIRLDGTTFVFDHAKHFLGWEGVMRFDAQTTAKDLEEVHLEGWGLRYFKVPDSLVFSSFVGLWGGWLVWRAQVEWKAAKN